MNLIIKIQLHHLNISGIYEQSEGEVNIFEY